ncbi:MAG: methionyl aminopeptidase [Acidobacteria bacterium]|nr:methionyl aminopeptidase [Acidobacteriota bacterium]
MIIRKTPGELEKMRRSGLLVWQILEELKKIVAVGATTYDLERLAERLIAEAGAKPAFKGYYVPAAGRNYNFVLCTSVNNEIIHGLPSTKRVLKEGDIVSIDTGVLLDGYYPAEVTQEALDLAVAQVKEGNRLFDICGSVERHVTSNGFSVVREFVGHGIGTKLHEDPQIPNYIDPKNGNPRLKEGMVLAIEPMVCAGRPEIRVLEDHWTAVTKDGSNSAHFEHCVAVTTNGPWILTKP